MQRDMDLIRQLLLRIEVQPPGVPFGRIVITGYSDSEVMYHLRLLHEAGLIEGYKSQGGAQVNIEPTKLTWEGHDFVEKARNETVWKRTMDFVKERGGGASFEIVKTLLVSVASQHFKFP